MSKKYVKVTSSTKRIRTDYEDLTPIEKEKLNTYQWQVKLRAFLKGLKATHIETLMITANKKDYYELGRIIKDRISELERQVKDLKEELKDK